ncbi:MAG TPA: hypothetical protein VFB78_10855 [Acidimicrobiales bacterium]|nr:hypothetical protein [Acidimicrobiales bacterium]
MTVFALSPDGAITQLTPDGVFLQAHVHPDGDVAACWGAERGEPRVWLAATDGSSLDAVGPERARHPVFDPTGTRLAFVLGDDSDPVEEMGPRGASGIPAHGSATQIAILDLASGDVTVLTDGPALDQRPCWSPDGSAIVFLRHGRLARVEVAGGEVVEIQGPQFAYRPWFSLDGAELFFIGMHEGHRRIHRMASGGGAVTVMPNDDAGHTHGPFADLGGEHLIVHSTREGAWWLYELPLDGAPARRIEVGSMASVGHGTRARNGVITFDGQTMDD